MRDLLSANCSIIEQLFSTFGVRVLILSLLYPNFGVCQGGATNLIVNNLYFLSQKSMKNKDFLGFCPFAPLANKKETAKITAPQLAGISQNKTG
jgi:hypothetical protein